ncbi:MAG: squalene/phytoene synthase family protein, partial [Candidatus Promineifilaceae bacterium]
MSFDAGRKGKFVTQIQLEQYTHSLAVAVTEAMHYFIGFDDYSPQDETRYAAVTGAHITHILRDAVEDAQMGYYNIPREYLDKHNIAPTDFDHKAFQDWVCDQVRLARRCFGAGKIYMSRVENLRCRLAGYAYIKRFEIVLDAIENEKYVLRAAYPERKTAKARIKMALSAIGQTIGSSLRARPSKAPALVPSAEV